MPHINNVARMLAKDTLVWRRELNADPETLWKAIATRDGLSHWFMPTRFDIVLGGPFSFQNGWDGTITRIEPRRLIQFNRDANSDAAYLRFELEERSAGTLFSLTDKMAADADPAEIFGADAPNSHILQPGGIGTHWSGVVAGYHCFVDALESYVTGTEVPSDYGDLAKRYAPVIDAWHSDRRPRQRAFG